MKNHLLIHPARLLWMCRSRSVWLGNLHGLNFVHISLSVNCCPRYFPYPDLERLYSLKHKWSGHPSKTFRHLMNNSTTKTHIYKTKRKRRNYIIRQAIVVVPPPICECCQPVWWRQGQGFRCPDQQVYCRTDEHPCYGLWFTSETKGLTGIKKIKVHACLGLIAKTTH